MGVARQCAFNGCKVIRGPKPSTIKRLTDSKLLEELERHLPTALKPLINELRRRLYAGRVARAALTAVREKEDD